MVTRGTMNVELKMSSAAMGVSADWMWKVTISKSHLNIQTNKQTKNHVFFLVEQYNVYITSTFVNSLYKTVLLIF